MTTNTDTRLKNFAPFLGFNAQGNLGPFTIYVNKHRRPVWYLTRPQLEPPSPARIHQKNALRACALAWQWLLPETKANWLLAARRAGLRISGYNLFTWFFFSHDRPTIETIERLTGIDLLDVP